MGFASSQVLLQSLPMSGQNAIQAAPITTPIPGKNAPIYGSHRVELARKDALSRNDVTNKDKSHVNDKVKEERKKFYSYWKG